MPLLRTTAFRLTLTYAVVLSLGAMLLNGLIYWQVAGYMSSQSEKFILGEMHHLSYKPVDSLPDEINRLRDSDLRGIMTYGLFDAQKQHQAGNLQSLPEKMVLDGKPHDWLDSRFADGAKVIARRLPDGQILVVGYEARTLAGVRVILLRYLGWSAGLILVAGLLFAVWLGSRPLRRIRNVQAASRRIAEGDFTQRLPISRRGDELDMLSSLVNRMVGEVGRLLAEVKSLEDNAAHDLRTPLNKLRAQLHRALIEYDQAPREVLKARLEKSLDAADVLLGRFRALQRIAEIDARSRRAGVATLVVQPLLEQLFEDYQPVAEEAGIELQLHMEHVPPLQADRELLAEALMNLLDNALKFTPAGGCIRLNILRSEQGTRIEVEDNGPGIAPDQREAVVQRFARGRHEPRASGSGLGLAIVAAVARTHGYQLLLEDAQPGLRVVLQST